MIYLEEVIQALEEAKVEANSTEGFIEDLKCEIDDAKSAAKEAEDSSYEARDKVEVALRMLVDYQEEQNDIKFSPDDVETFFIEMLGCANKAYGHINELVKALYFKSREWGLRLPQEDSNEKVEQ